MPEEESKSVMKEYWEKAKGNIKEMLETLPAVLLMFLFVFIALFTLSVVI